MACCTLFRAIACFVSLCTVLAIGLFCGLQHPDVAEAAIRQLVDFGGVPQSLFEHIQIKDQSVWSDMLLKGNLGLGEAFMFGKVDMELLPFFNTLLNGTSLGTRRKEGGDALGNIMALVTAPGQAWARVFNQQSRTLSMRVVEQHYNSGNDVYEAILGPTMGYTCGYWRNATTLDEAQTNKFDLIRRKMMLEPGMKVADLGMGWGFGAAHMAKHGHVNVTGVTLSKEQLKWAKDNLPKGLSINFALEDYRDHCLNPANIGTYDRVYSIGMFEHVGWQNYRTFFECVRRLLKPDGLAVVHTIGEPDFVSNMDPFLDKYIFPGAVIPSLSSVTLAFEDTFILEDLHNFGYDYARTLAAWTDKAKVFFAEGGAGAAYTPEFKRMWFYYLALCESLFELRINQLWQFVLSPRPTLRKGIERQV